MILEGDATLDLWTRILQYLGDLITQKRAEGSRPILMMDANDDWLKTSGKAFKAFSLKKCTLLIHTMKK